MLNISSSMFSAAGKKKNDSCAQLLIIISDGRGLISEGLENIREAVNHAINTGIFIVFIIIDNPSSKVS